MVAEACEQGEASFDGILRNERELRFKKSLEWDTSPMIEFFQIGNTAYFSLFPSKRIVKL